MDRGGAGRPGVSQQDTGAGDEESGLPAREQPLAAICGLEDPVRRSLYEFVASRAGRITRDEAAQATGVARSLAAYHLDRLVSLGLLDAGYGRAGGRSGPGAGRPAKVYARSDREFTVTVPPREYELAARLLAAAVAADQDGPAREHLRKAAERTGAQLARAAGGPARAAGTRRPAEARRAMRAALAAHQFEPYDDPSGRLGLRNCPFHQLVLRHPDVVCAMNLALIQGLARGLGADDLRPELDPGPGRCCVVVSPAAGHDPRKPEAP